MRIRPLWFILVIMLFGITTTGCSGGGGSGGIGGGPTPTITRMDAFGGSSGTISVSLDFFDSEGDIATITSDLYDVHKTPLGSGTAAIAGIVAGYTSGTLSGDLDFSSLAVGEYSFDLYLTDSGGRQSNVVSKAFSVEGGFGTAVSYPNPQSYLFGDTAIGDLNGDGRNDVVAIQGSNNTGLVLIYYQNASGGLDAPVSLKLNYATRGIAIADVNGDGKADLLISTQGGLVVCYQDPVTGQLGSPQTFSVTADSIFGLAAADLNGDGRNDIVVMAGRIGSPGGLSIFFQKSDGTLASEVTYTQVNLYFGGEIHVADMNNDGLNDIVVQSGQKELAVIRQTSAGVFSTTPDRYAVQTSYWSNFTAFALGDLNGDGRTDMVAVDPGNNGYINIFLQNATGTFDGPVLLQIADVPFGVEVADVTGDGLNDIIIDVSGGIVVFPQQPDHTFKSERYYSYPASSYGGSPVHQALSIGDVTGRGRLDAVVTWVDSGLYVLPYAAQITVH